MNRYDTVSALFLLLALFLPYNVASSFEITTIPPLLDVPTYSLATLDTSSSTDDTDGSATNGPTATTTTTGMNILTYATPVSVTPDRVWAIGLFKGTKTYENFRLQRRGILQMLTPVQSTLVRLLGGSSGRDIDKRLESAKLGFDWVPLSVVGTAAVQVSGSSSNNPDSDVGEPGSGEEDRRRWPLVLPGCSHYLRLVLQGELIDAGSHEIAICSVESMFVEDDGSSDSKEGGKEPLPPDHLSTAMLRDMAIITKQGRVAE